MSRGDSDRAAWSRGPFGDATAARDAGAPIMVAGVPSAARSRFAGPSGDAPARPPRSGDATGELAQATDSVHYYSVSELSEVAA
jgi:hypothetical protein